MIDVSENIYSYLVNLYGAQQASHYIDYIKLEPAQYIRVNSLKIGRDELAKRLYDVYKIDTSPIRRLDDSLKIESGKELISKTLEHIIGLFYIQSLSSMLPPYILNPSGKDIVLDLCAAPGSKSTQLSEMMLNKGTLLVNEVQLNRVKSLVYNLDRLNIINAGVLHFKGEILSKIYSNYFDKILVDVPCSGLGIIQKKEEVSNWWSKDRVKALSELQLKLLISAIKMLKPGGELVYSTCTLTPEENEFIIDSVLKRYPVKLVGFKLPLNSHNGFTAYEDEKFNAELSLTQRLIPWEVNSDGFYIAKIAKTDSTIPLEKLSLRQKDITFLNYKDKKINKSLCRLLQYYGIDESILSQYKFILKKNDLFFLNNDWEDDNPGVFERIGTKFGLIDRNGEIILHTQAAQVLQNFFTKNVYYIAEAEEIKRYLLGGVFKNKSNISGQCVISLNNEILGSAVVTSAGVKSRFPRAKRTQDIFKDF